MSAIPKEQTAIVVDDDFIPQVVTIPVFEPSDDQILIRAKAYALNPTDWKHWFLSHTSNSIVGSDVSGVVVKVGKNIQEFQVGDFVSTAVHGSYLAIPYPGAYSEYVVAYPLLTYKYNYELVQAPADTKEVKPGPITTFEDAASLSLSLGTVGVSFYHAFGLRKNEDYSQESILIWSGATSTGAIAIQIANWLGFKNIVVTASEARFEYLKELGATALYDYHDADVVQRIRKDFGDTLKYGLDTFSNTKTFNQTYETLSNTEPVIFDNLLSLTEKHISTDKKKKTNPVTFERTAVYLANGEDMVYQGHVVPAPRELVEAHIQFKKDIQPLLDGKRIKHIPLTFLKDGFKGMIEGLKILQSGQYANQKFVSRL